MTGQATAILIVLMFGAGTDYCLLVLARFKEELGRGLEASAALTAAVRRSAPAILSAGGIVVAAMLVLTLADYRATATMGPVLAVGTAVTVIAGLTLLPALLSILGPRVFWPAAPRERGADVGDRRARGPGAAVGDDRKRRRAARARRAGRGRRAAAAVLRRLVPRSARVRAGAGDDLRQVRGGCARADRGGRCLERRGHGRRSDVARARRRVGRGHRGLA